MGESEQQEEKVDGAPRSNLLRHSVLREMRRSIALGELKPGSRITERGLCETHGISRTVAREVIRQLDVERLGEVVPHKGLRIRQLTKKMVCEVFEVRAELEVLIIRAFIAKATKPQINHLSVILQRLKTAVRDRDVEENIKHSTRFITYMNETADNQIAGEILAHLNARIELVRLLAISWPGQAEIGTDQLGLILEKIAARDTISAEVEIRRYLQMALNSAILQLQEGVD